YAMLLAMVVRARRRPGDAAAFDPLLVLTSVLGLLWNLCSLPGYVLPKFGIPGPFPVMAGIGFGALGLLPAAVVHSVLRGNEGIGRGVRRGGGILAYGVRTICPIPALFR